MRDRVSGLVRALLPLLGVSLWLGGCPKRGTSPAGAVDGPSPGGGALDARADAALVARLSRAEPVVSALRYGVVSPNRKVRPRERPQRLPHRVALKAGRNELEAFQLVLTSQGRATAGIAALPLGPLRGAGGAEGAKIPARNLSLYRVGYYRVKVPSNTEGAPGRWPDPLIPDVDTYVGERRNAFPITVPAAESRAIWVDLLVPRDAKPGAYQGSLALVDGEQRLLGKVEIALTVGRFTLPSTASLRSAFGMDYAEPCQAHTGTDSCDRQWNAAAAYALRERYLRAALDHRFTISNVFFQPPPAHAEEFSRHVLPLINGRGRTRLPGARVTAVEIDGGADADLKAWAAFARLHGFDKLLLHYPVDEPGTDRQQWATLAREARRQRRAAPLAKTIITAPIEEARRRQVSELVGIFAPVLNDLEDRPYAGGPPGLLRPRYDRWLAARPGRQLWAYQSCMSHGCGSCGQRSPGERDTGWPSRVIDASAVQNRAFPWQAFLLDFSGELYFAATEQLRTAWDDNGQCKFSGSGDGTILYPGIPARIGGRTHIPVESIRMKMIREGMEDYEYLLLAAARDRPRTEKIARALFPKAYECAQPPGKLEAARDALFELINRR